MGIIKGIVKAAASEVAENIKESTVSMAAGAALKTIDTVDDIVSPAMEKGRRLIVKHEANLMHFGDDGTESIYIDEETRSTLQHGITKGNEYRTSTYSFYDQNGEPLYGLITKLYKKQNLKLYDNNGKEVGRTVVKGSIFKPRMEVYVKGEYKGVLEQLPLRDKSGSYMMGDLRIRYKMLRFEITDSEGSLIANETRSNNRRCIVYHEGDDQVFIALLFVCSRVIRTAYGEKTSFDYG